MIHGLTRWGAACPIAVAAAVAVVPAQPGQPPLFDERLPPKPSPE